MPKCQFVDPNEMRKSGFIKFQDIPVNQYQKTVKQSKADGEGFTDADYKRIFRDMAYIREFETMLNLVKTRSEYHGITYNNPGPAHLSMGQEAAAVGTAYVLDTNDFCFGSHRSHGELLAKAFSAIEKLDDAELEKIMREYFGGKILSRVEGGQKSVKELAMDFFLYGSISEIFGRETGFNLGLGGSMHTFFMPFGIYPNNALVGGSADIATGAALFKRVNRKPGIVVGNFGDGAIGCGPVWEAMNFAAMDQLTQLWPDEMKGGLPILFNIYNNSYGMGGQTRGETMCYDFVARIGAITPSEMLAERVDGFNPLAVIDATKRKKQAILDRKGPALLDVVTYRFSGHSPSDSNNYRTKEEIDAWMAQDPLLTYRAQLVEAGVCSDSECQAILEEASAAIEKAYKKAIDPEISPRINLDADPNIIAKLMYSNEVRPSMDPGREPDVLTKYEDNSRVQSIARKERWGFDAAGKPVSKNKVFQFREALFEAIMTRFYEDPTLCFYGEDVRDWGGAYAVSRGMMESIPYQRLFNAPISEGAIVGTAVGYCMCGGRAIAELMYCDFLGRAGDEVFNQMSKWQAMSAGIIKMPLVLRLSVGSKYGAQHSQDWSSLCTHIPGLKVVFPATPYDAKGLLNAALVGTDPVVFLESQRIYDVGEQFHKGGVPEGFYTVEFGDPDVKIEGKDITILSVGAVLYRVLDAVKMLKEKYGLEAEVIDARTLVPFNYEKVLASVKKTGRIVLVSDACQRGSFLNDMARNITEMAFDDLDAPPVVIGAKNWITPAHELETYFFPQASWILDAINEKILPLPGHTPTTNQTIEEQIRVEKNAQ